MLPRVFNNAVAITPSDSTPVIAAGIPILGIYVGGAGNVTVITKGGQTVAFTAPPVGTTIFVSAVYVKATGTTATALVGLW